MRKYYTFLSYLALILVGVLLIAAQQTQAAEDRPNVTFYMANSGTNNPSYPSRCLGPYDTGNGKHKMWAALPPGTTSGSGSSQIPTITEAMTGNVNLDCIKLAVLNPSVEYTKDFRFCLYIINTKDSLGFPANSSCTPWASEGGGAGQQLRNQTGKIVYTSIVLEYRDAPPNITFKDVNIGAQLFFAQSGGSCGGSSGPVYASANPGTVNNEGEANRSNWGYSVNGDDDPGCAQAHLQVSLNSPVLSCSPSSQPTSVGTPVTLHANGGVAPYFWNASPNGNPFVGTLPDFVVWYDVPGTKIVYLDDSNGHSTSCIVEVETPAPTPTPTPIPSNAPPSASNVNISNNYCATGPSTVTVNWTYSDPNNNPIGNDQQSAYQIQVANGGSGFAATVYDSNKVTGSNTSHTVSGLPLNRSLQARVRVWDSQDAPSAWSTGSAAWLSPSHPYPQVDFCWPENCNAPNPGPKPSAGSPIRFTDRTTFYDSGNNRRWLWNFGDGATSTARNPQHTYSTLGSYGVTLTATDSDGYACSLVKTIGVRRAIPLWREVAPGL